MRVRLYNDNKVWYYRVKKEDEKLTFAKFIKRFNFSVKDFQKLNKNYDLIAGKILFMPPSSKYYHIVGPLENYTTIANDYNCEISNLQEINKTTFLFIGQRIFL